MDDYCQCPITDILYSRTRTKECRVSPLVPAACSDPYCCGFPVRLGELHLVATEVLVVQAFEPAAQLLC